MGNSQSQVGMDEILYRLLEEKKYGEIITEVNLRLRGRGDDAVAELEVYYDLRSIAQHASGNYLAAKEDCTRLITALQGRVGKESNLVAYYHRRGVAHYYCGEFREAIADFGQCSPSVKPCYAARASANFELGNFLAVQEDLAQIFTQNGEGNEALGALSLDTLATAYSIRGHLYLSKGKTGRALNDLQQAVSISPFPLTSLAYVVFLTADREMALSVEGQLDNELSKNANNAVYFYTRGITRMVQEKYAAAVSDFETAVNLLGICGSAQYFLGLCHALSNHYREALVSYIQGYENGFVCPLLEEALYEALYHRSLRSVLSRIYVNEGRQETLLHFFSRTGNKKAVELLVGSVKDLDYLLAQTNQGKTALMLAMENHHSNLIPLLTATIVKKRAENFPVAVTNERLFSLLELNGEAPAVAPRLPRTLDLALASEYLERGLTETNALQVRNLFNANFFDALMGRYQIRIAQAQTENQKRDLSEESAQLMLAKYKYDQSKAISEGKTRALDADPKRRSETTGNMVQSFINTCLVKNFPEYSSYFCEVGVFFKLIQDMALGNPGGIRDLISRYAGQYQEGYLPLLSAALDFYYVIRNEKYGELFRPITIFVRFLANKFGGEEEAFLAANLYILLDELSLEGNDEKAFLKNLLKFYRKLGDPAAVCAIKILGCKDTITSSMKISKECYQRGDLAGAKAQISNLLGNLVKVLNLYEDEANYKSLISGIVDSLNLQDFVQLEGYDQYKLIIEMLTRLQNQQPNENLKAALQFVSRFIDELNGRHSRHQMAVVVIYLKVFLRLLIEYANRQQYKTLAYMGVGCLGFVDIFGVYNAINEEDSALVIANKISGAFVGFIRDSRPVIDIPEMSQLGVFAITADAVISVAAGLSQEEVKNFEDYLHVLRVAVGRAELDVDLFLRHDPNDETLQVAKKCIVVASGAVVVGDVVKVIYDVFNGNALEVLRSNLNRYLPAGLSSTLESGVISVLQGVPVVGGLVMSVKLEASLKELGKDIKECIDQAKRDICAHIDKAVFQVSSQMATGFSVLNEQVSEIGQHSVNIQRQLLELQKMMHRQEATLRDLALIAPIGVHNKEIRDLLANNPHLLRNDDRTQFIAVACGYYNKSLGYLSPGRSQAEALSTVFSPHFKMDFLELLYQVAPENYPLVNAHVRLPNSNMWLETVTSLIHLIMKLNEENLFNARNFNVDGLENVFNSSIELLKFLNYVTTEAFQQAICDSVRSEEVDRIKLYRFVSYCTLLGIPLTGFGEGENFWIANTAECVIWRGAMLDALAAGMPACAQVSVIGETLNSLKQITLSLGYILVHLSEEQVSREQRVRILRIKEGVLNSLLNAFYPNGNREDVSRELVRSVQLRDLYPDESERPDLRADHSRMHSGDVEQEKQFCSLKVKSLGVGYIQKALVVCAALTFLYAVKSQLCENIISSEFLALLAVLGISEFVLKNHMIYFSVGNHEQNPVVPPSMGGNGNRQQMPVGLGR